MLTKSLAEAAVQLSFPSISGAISKRILDPASLHIVVGTRYTPPTDPAHIRPNFYPEVVHRHQMGRPQNGDNASVAMSMAAITWRTGYSTRDVQHFYPHLVFPGETRQWGSWIEAGVLVSVSGTQLIYNEWAARLIVNSVLTLAYEHRQQIEGGLGERDVFLPAA